MGNTDVSGYSITMPLNDFRNMEAKIKAFDKKYKWVQIRAEQGSYDSTLYVVSDSPELAANEILWLKDANEQLREENWKLKNPSYFSKSKK